MQNTTWAVVTALAVVALAVAAFAIVSVDDNDTNASDENNICVSITNSNSETKVSVFSSLSDAMKLINDNKGKEIEMKIDGTAKCPSDISMWADASFTVTGGTIDANILLSHSKITLKEGVVFSGKIKPGLTISGMTSNNGSITMDSPDEKSTVIAGNISSATADGKTITIVRDYPTIIRGTIEENATVVVDTYERYCKDIVLDNLSNKGTIEITGTVQIGSGVVNYGTIIMKENSKNYSTEYSIENNNLIVDERSNANSDPLPFTGGKVAVKTGSDTTVYKEEKYNATLVDYKM